MDDAGLFCRKYIAEEIYMTDKNRSPFYTESPILTLSGIFANHKGADGGGLSNMLENLIQAQNQREAVSVRILPTMHWVSKAFFSTCGMQAVGLCCCCGFVSSDWVVSSHKIQYLSLLR